MTFECSDRAEKRAVTAALEIVRRVAEDITFHLDIETNHSRPLKRPRKNVVLV